MLVETGAQKIAQPPRCSGDFARRKRGERRECIKSVKEEVRIHARLQRTYLSQHRGSGLFIMVAYVRDDSQD